MDSFKKLLARSYISSSYLTGLNLETVKKLCYFWNNSRVEVGSTLFLNFLCTDIVTIYCMNGYALTINNAYIALPLFIYMFII